MSTLIRSSVPLHAQLEAALRESIRRGLWGPGDPVPSDRELSEKWQVSRSTVRQALDSLVRDGLIERHRGKGSFVVPTAPLRGFVGFYSFVGSEGAPGRLTTRVLSFRLVEAPAQVCERLRVMPGMEVLHLKLLRLLNETPALVLVSYMPAEKCSALRVEDFQTFPVMTEAITNRCGIPVVSQTQTFRAVQLEGEEAALLGVEPGSLGLQLDRVSFTDYGQPVESGLTVVRGDLVSYTLTVGRAGGFVGQALDRGANSHTAVLAQTS